MTDRGLFGPDSVTWRIMGEPVLWVAGFRALYLQALHPRVMRGTWQNTSFARPGESWGRFVRTAEFIGVRTYGTTDQVAQSVTVANPGLARYVLSGLAANTWYFAMTAYNSAGVESARTTVESIVVQ